MIGNNVGFIGRLTSDIKLKTVGEDNYVANFSVARNRYNPKAEHPETDYLDCVAWGATAKHCEKFFHKGDRMGLEGYLRTRLYESEKYSDENGNHPKIKVVELVVTNAEFIETKATASGGEQNNSAAMASEEQTVQAEPTLDDDDEALPF